MEVVARFRRPRIARQQMIIMMAICAAFIGGVLLFPQTGVNQAISPPITVNSSADAVDANPGNGACATAAGACTLRAAIQEANARPGADTILLPAGEHQIQVPIANVDLPSSGDFDIHSPMTITGAGSGVTIVDAGNPSASADPVQRGLDRLFEIHPGSGNVTISDLTMREGFSAEAGGAIQNWSSGLLTLRNVKVLDSYASKSGGGVNNADPADYEWLTDPPVFPPPGRIEIIGSTISGNAAGESGAAVNNSSAGTVSILGGSQVINNPGAMIPDPQDPSGMIPGPGVYDPSSSAIENAADADSVGTIRIVGSTVSGNYATQAGAGVKNAGSGTLIIERSTIADNTSEASGGGVYAEGGTLTITGSTISGNEAADGGGVYSGGSVDSVGLRPYVTISDSTFSANHAHASGGGINSTGESQFTLSDVMVLDNRAGDDGAGVVNTGRVSFSVVRVTFSGNQAGNEGGGLFVAAERPATITDSTFSGNDAGVPLVDEGTIDVSEAGGGGLLSEGGQLSIANTIFDGNTATGEGGAIRFDNLGDITLTDSVVRNNHAVQSGGGVENSGTFVQFQDVLVENNRAEGDGGGIHNSSSGPFHILNSTVQRNSGLNGGGLANAPDNDLVIRGSLFLANTARPGGASPDGDTESGGIGGGIFSLADGDAHIENTTISGNNAAVGGGGLFHDADGLIKLVNVTIWNNSAPRGGGVGVAESDFVPEVPPKANVALVAKNTIIGGSRSGGSCDWYISSEGGNLDGRGEQQVVPDSEGAVLPAQSKCFLGAQPDGDSGPVVQRDRVSLTFAPDAVADNGGPTLTHSLPWGSVAIDTGVGPCTEVDQRGTSRPQNGHCDIGAFEFVGPPPPDDDAPPETDYISGPIQDSLETVAFEFSGVDTVELEDAATFADEVILASGTPVPPGQEIPAGSFIRVPEPMVHPQTGDTLEGTDPVDLNFECRLLLLDPAEPPEPIPPWEPVPPELKWASCTSPWQVPLFEEGLVTFEVRAIDRAGNVDPTPATHFVGAADTEPPDTLITEMPPLTTSSRSATFSFSGTDNLTPPQFLEYECRLDSRDPDLWLECLNPTFFSNLTTGEHTIEVRATDGAELIDPTPARYTWTVGQVLGPGEEVNCDLANITLTASADGWVDEVNQTENYMFETGLTVRSGFNEAEAVGENARMLVRFNLPDDAPDCVLESATLRLYSDSSTAGRTLNAIPLAGSWQESTLTWSNQPGTAGSGIGAPAGDGYVEWNVLTQVQGMIDAGGGHGWQIRDAAEGQLDGGDQSFISREEPQDPPPSTLPVLVLRYATSGASTPDAPAGATTPTVVHCGQVITQSTLVHTDSDLTACLGEGLVIGGPNIVLDLNGETIGSGLVIEPGEEEGLISGIRNGGHSNVVIRNGAIERFGWGVLLGPGTTFNLIEDMTLRDNILAGVHLFDADDGRNGNTIQDNTLTGNGEAGISIVSDSENSKILGNHLFSNGGVGIHLIEANGHRIENNVVDGVSVSALVDTDAGLRLESSSDNIILGNTFNDAGDAGVQLVEGSNRNTVQNNQASRNGDAGITVDDSQGNTVTANTAHRNSDSGIVLSNASNSTVAGNDARFNPSGVSVSNSNDVVIDDNDVSDSLQSGIEVGNGINVDILNNIANRTGGSGIAFDAGAFDSAGNPVGSGTVSGNTANENLQDGLSIGAGGHLVGDNDAYNNAGYGIYADGNIDGTGNAASGNGGPEQCVGVVCDGSTTVPESPVDATGPETTIDEAPSVTTSSTSAAFEFSAVDTIVLPDLSVIDGSPATAMTYECRLDPGPNPEPEPVEVPEPPDPGEPPDPETWDPLDPGAWSECVSPVRYNNLEPGEHYFEVRAIDWAGNVDLTPDSHTWTIDPSAEPEVEESVAPNTVIFSGPLNPTLSTTAIIRFSGSDNQTPGLNLTYECRLDFDGDEGAWESCVYPTKTYTELVPGDYTFHVRATDRSLNTDQTPAIHVWTQVAPEADTTPPNTAIDSGPDQVTILTNATFTFSSLDPTATFECSLDGAAFTECASPVSLNGLAPGVDHQFRVRAVDAWDNIDPTPAEYIWTVGNTPVPTTVFCGQVVTRSIVLRNDLVDCLWDGLVVGAPNITIDLNGHLIDGKGEAIGVRIDGHDNVTVRNGRIKDFDYGVGLHTGTTGAIVESLTLERNQEAGAGLGHVPPPLDPSIPAPSEPPATFMSGVNNNQVRNNVMVSNNTGVLLINGASENLITGNTLGVNDKEGILVERAYSNVITSNAVLGSGEGIALKGSDGNTISGNTVSENAEGIYVGLTDSGSIVGLPSNDNVIDGNVITETSGNAIHVDHSDGNTISNNTGTGSNGDGLLMYWASESLVRGNNFTDNKSGIVIMKSSEIRIENNDTSNSGGPGIALQDLSTRNEVVGNTSSSNEGPGIYVGDEVGAGQGTLIQNNRTHSNTSYGIHVAKVTHTITGNFANDNGSWGIYVSEGSNGRFNIDGGFNQASGNHGPIDPSTFLPLQCYMVLCTGEGQGPSELIPPDTLLQDAPNNPSSDDVATFVFSGSDNSSAVVFECSLDGAPFNDCTSPSEYPVEPGPHTFQVRAVDASGNVDPTPAEHAWTALAPGAPDTTITSGPDLTTVQTSATFTFVASQQNAVFECNLDDAGFEPCDSPVTFAGLPVGSHTLEVQAIVGSNTDTSPATYAWTIGAAPVAATVSCGEIIVQSTRLLNDLVDCPGHGLVVGAHGITIDLNGHMIDGLEDLDTGILNNGFDSVTITNGTIQQFFYGVQLNPGSSLNVVSNLRVQFNVEAGVLLSDADQAGNGSTVRDNRFVGNAVGLWLASNTQFARVEGNQFAAHSADSIRFEFASQNVIEHNEIIGSLAHAIVLVGGGNNTVRFNDIEDSAGYGIAIGEDLLPSNGNLVEGNQLEDGQGGILVADSANSRILFNSIIGATGAGIEVELGGNSIIRGNDLVGNAAGVVISQSSGNTIELNNSSGSLGAGIDVGEASFSNIIRQNTASGNSGEGIAVTDSAPAGSSNVIDRNIANGNGGDGILVEGAGHMISGNSANVNGGFGIYAPIGAIDGGGNTAAGNMEIEQCVGVSCVIGTVPGSPQTWIVEGPGLVTNSRNAFFTYMGSDDISPITELVFECRFDSTNPLAWEDCEYPAEYLNLSPGFHTFEVRAIDMLGAGLVDESPATYTFEYVPLPTGVAPVVTIDIKPPLESQIFDALFTFHANEPDVVFECKVDQLAYVPCGFEEAAFMSMGAFEWTFEETEVGTHLFSVRAIDVEGNVSEPATWQWSIMGIKTTFLDGPGFTPGETPFDPPTGGEVASTTATLDFIANVADATYECSVDLGPFLPCSPPVVLTGLTPNQDHNLRVVATDIETGQTELEAAEFEWTIVDVVDVTPPETTIERAPNPAGSSSTIFEFQGTDDLTPSRLLVFECRVDSTSDLAWFACESPFNLLDIYGYGDVQMAPGIEHTFEVRARDQAEPLDPNAPQSGNPDPSPATHTWLMQADTTAPGTGILSGPPARTGETSAAFEFFGTDNATPDLQLSFECAIDALAWLPCDSPATYSNLSVGDHTFRVRAVDLAGNVDASLSTQTWTVVAAPQTTITSGPSGQIINGQPPATPASVETAIFLFESDQTGSTFECSLDGVDFIPCASPRAYWVVADGTHVLEVRAVNPEGVVEVEPAVYEWLVQLGPDVAAPNTSITTGPQQPEDPSQEASFQFTGTDNRTLAANLTFQCSLDGQSFNNCGSPFSFSSLSRGQHELRVRAVDAVGNIDATPASYVWTVAPPPVVTILTAPAEQSESTTATFTFESDVPNVTFTCWFAGLMEECTSPKTYTGLAVGEHLFAVLATTAGGITGEDWEEFEWTIGDFSAPLTTITSGPPQSTTSTGATFEFTSEPGVTFFCSINGSSEQACVSPKTYGNVEPGLNTFTVYAVSPLLGVDPIPTSYTWTIIDTIAPDTFIQYGPADVTASTNAYFGFSSDDPTALFECSLDGTSLGGECEFTLVLEALDPGQHELVVAAVDLAGNVDPTPAVYEWTVIGGGSVNTPAGTNVIVTLPVPTGGDAVATFLEVTVPGITSLSQLDSGPALPAGYFQGGSTFFDISTTADGEPISLCLPYDADALGTSFVRLLQFDGELWLDVTTTNDVLNGVVCGLPEEFTLFAVAGSSGSTPLAAITSGPPAVSTSTSATFTFIGNDPDVSFMCSINDLPVQGCSSPMTFHQLEEGGNLFTVSAIGADGQLQVIPTMYEWEVVAGLDTVAPNTSIISGPAGLSVNFLTVFDFTGTDDRTPTIDLEYECSIDDGPYEQCEPLEPIEIGTAGVHTIQIRAIDDAGNVDPTPATRTWTIVDLSAPETGLVLTPEEETSETTATFEFEGFDGPLEEPVTQFECSLDNQDFTSCTSPVTYSGLADGVHVFQVRARDLAGVVDPTPEVFGWLIIGGTDVTPPDTFIVGFPTNPSGPEVVFGFIASEPVAEFECSLDGGTFAGCDGFLELTDLESGEHTIAVRAIDLAEVPNVDASPAEFAWTVVGRPDTFIDTSPPLLHNSYTAVFEFSSDQTDATFECAVDGGAFVSCTSPYTAFVTTEDVHEFEVRAGNAFVDLEGAQIVDETPATYSWTIQDITAPDTTISSATFLGPTDLREPNSYRFVFTGEDNGTAFFELDFECAIDDGPWEACSTPHFVPLEELAGGDHVFKVRAVDDLGNEDPTPAEYEFTTEGEPATTIVTGSPALNSETDATEATFTFSSDQGDATFECALDGAEVFTACSNPVTFTDVPYGEHELLVRAVSPLGTQVDLTPAEYTWITGDLTAPTTTIEAPLPPVSTLETTVTVNFSGVDDTTPAEDLLYQCSLAGPGQTALPVFCTSPVTYNNLLAGDYTFEVVTTHLHLLAEPVAATVSWTVEDQTAPETTIASGPAANVALGTEAIFTFTSNEPDAGFECALDPTSLAAATFSACATATDPTEQVSATVGEHTLYVRALDPSGNVDATPESQTWTVIAPPDTTITADPVDPSAVDAVSFAFFDQAGSTYECSLVTPAGAQPFESCISPLAITGLADGEHELLVRATTALGEVETTPASYLWTVALPDSVSPETTLVATPPAVTVNPNALFAFSGTDNRTAPALLGFECSIDGAAFAPCSSPHLVSGLGVGSHTLEVAAIDGSDNTDLTPASHTWNVEAPAADNTQATAPATVDITSSGGTTATVTFASVETAGHTAIYDLEDGPVLPDGYSLDGALYVDISTTAIYTAPVTVCLSYAHGTIAEPVRLLHFDSGAWVDITTTHDPDAEVICGVTDTLSPFAIATGSPTVAPNTTIVTGPSATTMSTTAEFTFSSDDSSATFECSLDAADTWGSCVRAEQFTGLALGNHELRVRAKNGNGNVDASPASYQWTVTPQPDTVITSGPIEATESTTATFAFELDQPVPGVTFECAFDESLTFNTCESGITYTDLGPGEHDFQVRAVVDGFIEPESADWSWDIGNVPGAVTFVSTPGAATESTSATFEFTTDETDTFTFMCSLDGATPASCASPVSFEVLAVGPHTFAVYVLVNFPIVDAVPAVHAWTIADETAPDTTITFGAANVVSSEMDVSISFTSSELGSTFECRILPADFAPCSSPAGQDLPAGTYTFEVRAVDLAENFDATPASETWTVVDPPVAAIGSGPDPDVVADTRDATFTFSSETTDATFECALDNVLGPWVACESPHQATAASDGEHALFVRAVHPLGIRGEPVDWTWAVETGPPVATIVSGPPMTGANSSATFTFSANEPGVTFACTLDGVVMVDADAQPIECLSPFELTNVTPGEHTFGVTAIDETLLAGPEATYTWTVVAPPDTTAPETSIDSWPENSGATSATFEFSSNETSSTFECSLDGAAFAPCDSPLTTSGLAVGMHTFEVRAVDEALNVDGTPDEHVWLVKPPADTTIVTGPPDPSTSSTANFTFESSQPIGDTFECSLDGAPFIACASPLTLTNLADGSHTLQVRATSGNGGVDPSPASHAWTIDTSDTTPPETTIASGPPAVTSSTSATFSFTASETGSTFECSLDGGAFAPCAATLTLTGLGEGAHTLDVRATDAEGNVEQTPERHTWTVDLPPDTTIDSGPTGQTESTSASITFSSTDPDATFQCSVDGEAFVTCSSPRELSGLTLGGHSLEVRAMDAMGNLDSTPATISWSVVDTTAPETTIASGPDAVTSSASATFTFTSNEAGSSFECDLDNDGASFSSCVSPLQLNDLAVGEHTLQVRAKDPVGTLDSTPATFTWTIDQASPVTTVTGAPDDLSGSTEATFEFLAADNHTAAANIDFVCALDTAAFSACTSPAIYTGLGLGSHTFQVQGTDEAGNTETEPVAFNWNVVNTGSGSDVTVVTGPEADPAVVSLTFAQITTPGTTTVAVVAPDEPLPATHLMVGDLQYDVTTTADYEGAVAVCFTYDPAQVENPQALVLMHHDGTTWQDVTTSNDVEAGVICGEVTSLSPFAIAVQAPADTTKPETTIETGPDLETSDTSATFTFSANEPNVTYRCSLNRATWTTCSNPHEITGLAVGEYELRVVAVDAAGNFDSTSFAYEWTVVGEPSGEPGDVTAPETSIESGPAAVTTSATADFTFTAGEAGSTFNCSLNRTAWRACASPLQITDLPVGEYELRVRATDSAGNTDTTPAIHEWVVGTEPEVVGPDATPPDTVINAGPASTSPNTTALFQFSSTESPVTFECKLDAGAFTACGSSTQYSNLAQGVHTLQVRTIDAAGNVDATPASYSWTVGPGPNCGTPVTLTAVADAWINQGSPSDNKGSDSTLKVFSKNKDNNRTLVRFNLPAIPQGCVVESATLQMFSGSHKPGRTIQAIPIATSWTENGVTWNNQPGTTGTAATTSSGSGNRQWTVTGQVQGMYASGTSNGFLIRDASENNDHEQQFNSREKSSNRPQLIIRYVAADLVAPDTLITGGPSQTEPTEEVTASVTFVSDETGATFQCSLDGAAFASCASPLQIQNLAVGGHTLEIRARDTAGNIDQTPARLTWTVGGPLDTTAPETTITLGPEGTIQDTAATFEFSSDDPAAIFECSYNRTAWVPCGSPVQLTQLPAGDHQLRVRAIDEAGNKDASPATRDWRIEAPQDTAAPDTFIDATPEAVTSSTNADFVFSSNETGSSFQCSFNRAAWQPCAPPVQITGLGIDDYEFRVRAIDPAGNVDASPAVYEWTVVAGTPVDVTPPQLADPENITVEAVDASGASVGFEIPWAVDDVDGPLTASCDHAPGGWFGVGDTLVTCSAQDSSGNRASVEFQITVLPPPSPPGTTGGEGEGQDPVD